MKFWEILIPFLDMVGVVGSSPIAPTKDKPRISREIRGFFVFYEPKLGGWGSGKPSIRFQG
jgi:hypothetical protein